MFRGAVLPVFFTFMLSVLAFSLLHVRLFVPLCQLSLDSLLYSGGGGGKAPQLSLNLCPVKLCAYIESFKTLTNHIKN